jgi:uncharacterized protein YjbI with pentapeptide repeats
MVIRTDVCHAISYANLSRANLSGADLSGANLAHTDLQDADLTGARNVQLAGVEDLTNTTMPDGSKHPD